MKEPNIGTPDEDEIRAHFGNLLHPEKEIEIIPHTKIWATRDGVLLWDPKNGFADPGGKRIAAEPKFVAVGDGPGLKVVEKAVVKLKRVIYLTGPAGSGKTTLVGMLPDAVEVNRGSYIGFTDLSRSISKYDTYETVVITSNGGPGNGFDLNNALRIWCRERKLIYHNINLTSAQNGN